MKYSDFASAINRYYATTKRVKVAIEALKQNKVLNEGFMKILGNAAKVRARIYDKCVVIEDRFFDNVVKTLAPLCNELLLHFKVSKQEIDNTLPSTLMDLFEKRS